MVLKILSIVCSRLRNREHLQFIKQILAVLLKYDPEKLNIHMLVEELEPLVEEEETAISVEQGSALTAERDVADRRRDRLHAALFSYVKSIIYDEDEVEMYEAALRVMRIIKQVGNPWKLTDQAATTMINELGKALEAYKEDCEKIGAVSRIVKLLEANDKFVEIEAKCIEEKANRPSGDVNAVRIKINPVYQAIVAAINADINRFKDGRFDAVVAELNVVIKDYITLLAQRKGRNTSNNDAVTTENDD